MRFTDVDAGITDADIVDEKFTVNVWPEHYGDNARWNWELWEEGPTEDESVAVDGGMCDTQAEAETAGENAKAEYVRQLIRK